MVKSVFALMVPKFLGKMNFDDGIFVVAAIIPIGAGLHEPVFICRPFVIGRLGTVAQKLMKLLEDVRDATWPASGLYSVSEQASSNLGVRLTHLDHRSRSP